MANTGKKINQKALLGVLKSIGIAAGGTIASGMVAKILDEKILKVDATTTGVKGMAAGLVCTALGSIGAIKAKEDWQKDFSKGFATAVHTVPSKKACRS